MTELIDNLANTPERMRSYQRERAVLELTDLIGEQMEKQDVSRKELSGRLRIQEAYLIGLLDGQYPMEVRYFSDIFTALGRELHFSAGLLPVQGAKP